MVIKFVFANSIAWYKRPVNNLLKYFDNCTAGHFAIYYSGFTEIMYESVMPKSQKSSVLEWKKHYQAESFYEFEVPKHLEADVFEFLQGMLGRWYAFDQIFMIAGCILFKPFNNLFGTAILNHERALICTEYGSRFVERFMNYKLEKSHDNIGLSDMKRISIALKNMENAWK